MKKIGIITINGDNNYGNRLQNYALERTIVSLGYDAETIVFPAQTKLRDHLRLAKNSMNKNYREKQKDFKKMNKLKSIEFKNFREKYLNNVEHSRNEDFSEFDRFICGSDQIWNPSWRLIDEYWLRFVPENKRFSYAASMATTSIHKSNMKKLSRYLNEMNEISVRESESIELIRKFTDKKVELVIDPTMLLRKEDYQQLINEQQDSKVDPSKKYIIIYSLEGLPVEFSEKVEKYAKKNNFEIIKIMGNKYNDQDEIYNPIEFVEAIEHAQLVISDSFHCGVFSILMETPFVLFDRIDGLEMNSRIMTLLDKFDLQNQFYCGGALEESVNIDFFSVTKKVAYERKISMNYLKHILAKDIQLK